VNTKVGLLTLPLSDNYGGIIQCVALYQFLSQNNVDVHFIRKLNNRTFSKEIVASILELMPGQNIRGIRSRYLAAKVHLPFLKKYMPQQTRPVRTGSEIEAEIKRLNIDTVVVGSDQVWRFEYQGDSTAYNYFLDFGPQNIRRVSYAASFGHGVWRYPERTEAVTELLGNFDAVSVREISGREICRNVFKRQQCEVVLDPTLLVDRSFYESVIDKPPALSAGRVLTYVLDHADAVQSLAKQVVRKLGSNRAVESLSPYDTARTVGLPEWLQAFRDTEYVITDSFHGVVFSIIFQKHFVVVPNVERGIDRFTSLLGQLGLQDRILTAEDGADVERVMAAAIDYPRVNAILSELRAQSSEYLLSRTR